MSEGSACSLLHQRHTSAMHDRRSFIADACMGAAASQLFASIDQPTSFRSVRTVEALREIDPQSRDVMFVAGYHRPGDGGGGLFVGDGEATRKNSGTVIAPHEGREEGRWVRWRPSEQYNIRAFGAHPDRDDNAREIQACFDAAAEEGGTVYVPPGEYRVSRPLIMQPYVAVNGEGMASVIQKTTQASGPSLQRSLPNRDVSDKYDVDCIIAVDRPRTDLKFSQDVEIKDVRLRGFSSCTGQREDRNTYGLYAPRLLRAQIDGVTASEVQVGFHFKEVIVSELRGCRASRVEVGFEIPDVSTGGGTSLTLTSCYASDVDRWGYRLRGLSYSTLVGCACDHANKERTGGGYLLDVCHGLTLSSCGCEATVAPVLRAKHSEVVLNGLKTFEVRGQSSRSGYIEVMNSTLQVSGGRLDAMVQSKETRNGLYEKGADVTYAASEQPSGGAPALVDEQSSVLCIGERAAESSDAMGADATVRAGKVGFEASETVLTPKEVRVNGQTVLRERQPRLGKIVDATEGTSSRRLRPVKNEEDLGTINDNFATLCRQLERIRALLGRHGHGLTEDDEE